MQRAPGLMLALEESVDADRRPGRFLLTGSADLMALPRVAASLAGRMEVIRLFPLAQCEMRGASSNFLSAAFAGEVSDVVEAAVGNGLVKAVLAGGYPEALTRCSWARRQDWYAGYVEAIVQRDVRDVAHVDQLQQMPKLLRVDAPRVQPAPRPDSGRHAGQGGGWRAAGRSPGRRGADMGGIDGAKPCPALVARRMMVGLAVSGASGLPYPSGVALVRGGQGLDAPC